MNLSQMKAHLHNPRGGWSTGVLIGLLLLVPTVIAVAGQSGSSPTKGRIPDSAWKGNSLDVSLVPDFIPALDSGGNTVGWVSKKLAIPQGAPSDSIVPVYGDDLTTLVGNMYPGGVGFVRVGAAPSSMQGRAVVVSEEPPSK